MTMYALAILLTIAANVGYHLFQRTIRPDANPALSLVVTYVVALLLSVALLPAFDGLQDLRAGFRRLGWSSYALGGAIVLLELGFLLAYRARWDLGVAAAYSNVAVALILLPIGVLAFGEGFDARKGLGVALAVAGLVLLTRPASPSP
jgi:drug/metabolite transporter (DMT)-like permease